MPLHSRLTALASRRAPLAAAFGATFAFVAAAGTADAKILEVGSAPGKAAATCPASPCLAVSRTTGYQVKVGAKRGVYTVPAAGKIVAWSVTLGNPNAKQIAFFDKGYGEASAGISVLRQRKHLFSRVRGQSPVVKLEPYFGQTVQFPLSTALSVRKGDVIGLTVPTWAPALSQLLSDGSSWRASRAKGKCDDTETQTAQTKMLALTQYRCLYKAQLTYTATLITNPVANPTKKKK